jgi:hypothetical protein
VSNYTKSTNFATKDALPSGDPLKIVKGTEIDTEFNNIVTAVATKLDITSLYPVGSIYINASDSANPASLFGFGTWSAFGAGRVLVGLNSSNALFDTAEETGGSYDATLVAHTHTGTTGGQSATHSHGATTSIADPGHSHQYVGIQALGSGASDRINASTTAGDLANVNGAVTGITASTSIGNANADHNHSFTTASSGSSATNANIQPYITVYMWKRTA